VAVGRSEEEPATFTGVSARHPENVQRIYVYLLLQTIACSEFLRWVTNTISVEYRNASARGHAFAMAGIRVGRTARPKNEWRLRRRSLTSEVDYLRVLKKWILSLTRVALNGRPRSLLA
jgi:hypothetical protein